MTDLSPSREPADHGDAADERTMPMTDRMPAPPAESEVEADAAEEAAVDAGDDAGVAEPPATKKTPRIPKLEDFPPTGPNALATFSQRAAARMIDVMIVFLPYLVLSFVWVNNATGGRFLQEAMEPGTTSLREEDVALPAWFLAIGVSFAVAYEIIATGWKGKTVGKWIAGLRIARYADGTKPTWEQAVMRCLLPTAAGVATAWLTGVWLAGAAVVYASAYWTPLRRGWHDDAGGTVVVRTR